MDIVLELDVTAIDFMLSVLCLVHKQKLAIQPHNNMHAFFHFDICNM